MSLASAPRPGIHGSYTGAESGLGPIKDQLLTLLTNGIVANNGTQHGAIPLADISMDLPMY